MGLTPRRGTAVLATASVFLALVLVIQAAGGRWGMRGREDQLRRSVVEIREAVERFRADHGFFPCAAPDGSSTGDPALFVRQLTEYTNAAGEPSPTASVQHVFGPYLEEFPAEPITGSAGVVISTQTERLIPEIAAAVEEGTGRGGWYYEVRSGNVVANLGADFPSSYARF
jgi:hypothetical protein